MTRDFAPGKDWISDYMEYQRDIASPEIFRLWSAISALGAALERRVSISTSVGPIFPNLFVLLVAPPGVGKSQAIGPVQALWRATKKLFVAPNSVTKAALIDALDRAKRVIVDPNEGPMQYNSLNVASSEFGVLVPMHDLDFLSVLNDIFDCPATFQEERRHMENQVDIINPQISILAGTQPGFLSSLLPEEAWLQGFTSRLIMVYAGTAPKMKLFGPKRDRKEREWASLVHRMTEMTNLMGDIGITEEAQEAIESWYDSGCPPVPEHSRLIHYTNRRILHLLKLCAISCVSRGSDLQVDAKDVERSLSWLLAAEAQMPNIFREMAQRSDSQILQELHLFMWQIWAKSKKPIDETIMYEFLSQRMASDKIERLVSIAEKSGFIAQDKTVSPDGKHWVPRPKQVTTGINGEA